MHPDEELFHHDVQAWTVGQLRRALDGVPDDTPLQVNVAEEPGGDTCDIQVVIGAGFGTADWGDGRGPQRSDEFALDCEFPTGDYYRRGTGGGR